MAAALIALTIKNIQQLHEITEEGVRDSLTGCYNRRHGLERLAGELRRASRTGRVVSVLMLDLDYFKAVNDAYGHLSGDRVLTKVGAQLLESLRSTDVPCRYGGDEFLIVLPETPGQAAEHVASCLQRDLSRLTFAPVDERTKVSVGIGSAASTPGERDVEAVIERADRALFEAKGARRRKPQTPTDLDVEAAAS